MLRSWDVYRGCLTRGHYDSCLDGFECHGWISLIGIVLGGLAREGHRVVARCEERELVIVRWLRGRIGHLRGQRLIWIACSSRAVHVLGRSHCPCVQVDAGRTPGGHEGIAELTLDVSYRRVIHQ